MSKYKYDDGKFIIEDYDEQKPFASFLPGVAGVNGIPMWVYYTNRGQGIAGFGVENKDGAIFDFVPANVAYRRTELQGFRTFIKLNGSVHEIFSSISSDDYNRSMHIETNSVSFVEINKTLGLKIDVKFFSVTNKNYPGLVRKVIVTNLDKEYKDLEIIDGLVTMWPYKNTNFVTKNMSNLAVAWFETYNADNNMPFYRNRSTTEDTSEIGTVEAGHFYAAVASNKDKVVPVIYDPDVIFGQDTSLLKARNFEKQSLTEILSKKQVSANKLPCAFSAYSGKIQDEVVITSVIGKMSKIEMLHDLEKEISVDYFEDIEKEAFGIGETLTNDVGGKTAYPIFDAYVKQSYLDNLLRGGYPLVFDGKEGPIVYHVYSRIHGDMEREYNEFYVEPAYYSHGIGNFRDVNQNRRNDVYVVKEAGLFNIKQFMDLLQIDGQNPLSIKGSTLKIDFLDIKDVLELVNEKKDLIEKVISKTFTPGELLTTVEDYDITLNVSKSEFLNFVLSKSTQENQAAFGEGFWVDHWTYNMDLVDNYLNVFPDRIEELLFEEEFRYFQSPEIVLPRSDKYVLTKDGKVRQYDSIHENHDLELNNKATNWMKTTSGEVYTTNLFTKLLTLVINKITNLDPSGMGVMMNSNKPGWNDAMNGLPGLFGSGTSEVIELNRVVDFLIKGIQTSSKVMLISKDIATLCLSYMNLLEEDLDQLDLFEKVQDEKEKYLKRVSSRITDEVHSFETDEIINILSVIKGKITDSIEAAIEFGEGIIPSYLVHEAVEFEVIKDKYHPINNLPNVDVTKWTVRKLPLYLEAPARYLKQIKDVDEAKMMYEKIKKSQMYDEKLAMYITSESLEDESLEIGRARAFTAGWLERESVFMHMEYKYLLGLLKGGLYHEFFEAIKTALPPFMDPSVYGRSTLENSSFIASSRNPNPDNHGRGFVSRLTGTTSEMITMWLHMMTGTKMFSYDKELNFKLKPVLSSDYFDENNEVQSTIFGDTKIIYSNPTRKDTYGAEGVSAISYKLVYKNEKEVILEKVSGKYAESIRNSEIKLIDVTLG